MGVYRKVDCCAKSQLCSVREISVVYLQLDFNYFHPYDSIRYVLDKAEKAGATVPPHFTSFLSECFGVTLVNHTPKSLYNLP